MEIFLSFLVLRLQPVILEGTTHMRLTHFPHLCAPAEWLEKA